MITTPFVTEQPKSKVMNGSKCLKPHIVVENLNIDIKGNHILKDINMTIPDIYGHSEFMIHCFGSLLKKFFLEIPK